MSALRFDFYQTIQSVARQLSKGEQPETGHLQEAQWIVQFVLKDHKFFSPFGEVQDYLNRDQMERIKNFVARRLEKNEPIGYILGDVPFCDLTIKTRPPTLIPRIETEEWCAHLIEQIQQSGQDNLNILDLCTGSGCIALALAKAFPNSSVLGIDISEQAIELAEENKELTGLENVNFVQADLFQGVEAYKTFDLIVSNPPYIDEAEWQTLEPDVKDWEDKRALVASQSGLEFYEKISGLAGKHLDKSKLGWLVFEIGATQSQAVSKILETKGFSIREVFTDSFEKHRAIFSNLGELSSVLHHKAC